MKKISSPWYGTGRFWFFDNGQYGEKLEIKEQIHYSLMMREGKPTGLYFYKSNDTGNSCFGGGFTPVASLTGEKLEKFNELLKLNNL